MLGSTLHITHRCRKKEFLFKFARNRQRWRYWLFEARKRYDLCVLDYIVTSNHIHLLVRGIFRESIATESGQLLKETATSYDAAFTGKMACLRDDNRVTVRWTA